MAPVADAALGELAGEDLPAVHVDLDLEGEPALQPHVDQPEVGLQEVEVEVQTLAPAAADLQALGLGVADHVEGAARLDRRQHADQALGDGVALDDLLGDVPLGMAQALGHGVGGVQVGATRLGGQGLGVSLERLAHPLDVAGVALQQHPLGAQEPTEGALGEQPREMSLEDHPVEGGERADDVLAVSRLEAGHGPSLRGDRHGPQGRSHAVGDPVEARRGA